MERRDDSLKVFDGTKFAVWKFHMEICFEEKLIMDVVNGSTPAPSSTDPEDVREAWNKKNSMARRMISSAVTLPPCSREFGKLYHSTLHVVDFVFLLPAEITGEYLLRSGQFFRLQDGAW